MMTPEMLPNEYIGMYAKENTRYQKQFAIRRFLKVYLGHDVPDLNSAMQEYLKRDKQQIAVDLTRYQMHPSFQKLAPKTRSLYTSLVITYFEDCCNLSLSGLQKKMMRKAVKEKVRAVTVDANPTREMIRNIINHCNERHTAEILISVSSGLRFGEILQLQHDDIDYTTIPVTIHLRGETTKSGEPRITYLSTEAVDALKAYYRVRDSMIQKSDREKRRGRPNCVTDTSLIFPWSMNNEGKLISDAIVLAGYTEKDKRTGRYKVHFHLWRKYFLTQAKRYANPAFVEAWAGHSGYLSSSYHRPSDEEDRAEYLKAEIALTINIPDDYMQIKLEQSEELDDLRKNNERLTSMLHILQSQLETMQMQQKELMVAQRIGGGIPPHSGPCETNDDESD